MFHCPHCGSSIHEEEHFCVICGKKLPLHMEERIKETRVFNKWWMMPIATIISIFLIITIYFFILQSKHEQAEHHYLLGKDFIEEKQFKDARKEFDVALSYYPSFNQAQIAVDFLKTAEDVEEKLKEIPLFIEDKEYTKALDQINTYEDAFGNLQGQVMNDYINKLNDERDIVELEKIKNELSDDPSIQKLKNFLWDAQSINTEEGIEIADEIQSEIIDYTFSKASEQLNNNQFNDALLLVEDGLKYAEDSTKLQSLKTTIDKEKSSFETAQQERIEQAITIAEEEKEYNQNDAIQLEEVDVLSNDQGNIIVKGKVKSAATVPLTSVFVEYELSTGEDEPFETNRVFVFPDVLYPDEYGQFEFTHYDIDKKEKDVSVNVNKITWYID